MSTPVVMVNGVQMGVPVMGTDAVPMIDAQTAGILQVVNNFTVKQRVAWVEAITQGCIEQSNVYDVYDASNGNLIFVAMEKSGDCERCCCAPGHSLFVEFKPAVDPNMARMGRSQLMNIPAVMTLERAGCCSAKPCLCCFACTESCQDGMALHAGPPPAPEAGTIMLKGEKCVGFAHQPLTAFTPTLNVMDRDVGENAFRPIAKVEGPCIFGGCTELCCSTEFPISKLTQENLTTKTMSGDVALITKRKPTTAAGALREAMTDSDTYTIEFAPDANLAPQQKALMMGTLILTDYMFFEQDNGMCKCENGALKITLCEMFCCGCLCPCNIVLKGQSG